MLTILITGAMGFVGSNLSRILNNRENFLIGIDNFLSSEMIPENEDNLDLLVNGSIEDDQVLKNLEYFNIDIVFHLATYHGNSTSIINPLDDHRHGAYTTLKLLEFLRKKNIKRFVYASAGCSMGSKSDQNCTLIEEQEEVSLKMDTPYQISKAVGEFYCNFYYKEYNIPTIRARFQNVYGPGELLGAGQWRGSDATIWRNVVPIFIYRALKNEPLVIYGSGDETRDFIYVDDIVSGLLKCALVDSVEGDVFNIAYGKETSIRKLAELIINKVNSSSKIQFIDKRNWDSSYQRFASTVKSEEKLGFKAETALDEGLDKTISWTIGHLNLIDKLIKKHRYYTCNQ